MRQESVDSALEGGAKVLENSVSGTPKAIAANVVYEFLTRLIDNERNWLHRQLLRTVRGFVRQWQDKSGRGNS